MKKEKQNKTKQSKAKQNQKANSVKKPHLILSFLAYLLKLYTSGKYHCTFLFTTIVSSLISVEGGKIKIPNI